MVGVKRKNNGEAIVTPKKAKLQNGSSQGAKAVHVKRPLRTETADVDVDESDLSSDGSDISADEYHLETHNAENIPKAVKSQTEGQSNGICSHVLIHDKYKS